MTGTRRQTVIYLLAAGALATGVLFCWQKLVGRDDRGSNKPVAAVAPPIESGHAVSPAPATQVAADSVDGAPTNVQTDGLWRLLRDVEYARIGDRPLRLDLYLPREAKGTPPLVVWIHGGGWRKGTKDACRMVFLVQQGFAVASVEYRLAPEGVFPDPLHDCKAAIRFLRANAARYGIDPDRIGVAGGSAGGHLAALVGLTGDDAKFEGPLGIRGVSSRVQAVCDCFGPTDLTTVAGTQWDNPKGAVYHLLGGTVAQNMQRARDASPLLHVAQDSPPFLILHGDRDQTVPLTDSEKLAQALKQKGASVQMHIVPGAGHGGPAFFTPATQQWVSEFFRQNLSKPSVTVPVR